MQRAVFQSHPVWVVYKGFNSKDPIVGKAEVEDLLGENERSSQWDR